MGAAMSWELFAVFLGSSIRLATPMLLAGIGEMVSERAGVLNMSIEGMMLTSAFAAAVGSWATGDPLLGLLLGILAVQPIALLQAVLSNTLRANQIVSGIGINICWARRRWPIARFSAHGRARKFPASSKSDHRCSAISRYSAQLCSSR